MLSQSQIKVREHVSIPLKTVFNEPVQIQYATYLRSYKQSGSNYDHVPLKLQRLTTQHSNSKPLNRSTVHLFSFVVAGLDIKTYTVLMHTLNNDDRYY